MTDQNTLDLFEQRIAAGLARYVASATDARPAAEIADEAMRPRGVGQRLRQAPRSRRLLFFSLAAVLLVPAAVIGAGALLRSLPDPINQVQLPAPSAVPSFVADATPVPTPLVNETRAVVVRRTTDGEGVSIYSVRADGAERLLREVQDSILPDGNSFQEWGLVSASGWIALAEQERPWNMVLVDLRDSDSEPWIVPDSTLGGISASWGPQGYVAAPVTEVAGGPVVIVDPETQSEVGRTVGGMIGGGPTIIWNADGTGLVDRRDSGGYGVQPIDGGTFRPGFPAIFSTRGEFGDGGSGLRICAQGENCPGGDDGRILRQELDGSSSTIWEPTTTAAASAMFGPNPGDVLVQTNADAGREIVVERITGGNLEVLGSIDRPSDWRYWSMHQPPPDSSMLVFFVDLGNEFFGTAIAPSDGSTSTLHLARFAGYLGSTITDASGDGTYVASGAEPVEPATEAYALPPIGELIAAEIALNSADNRAVIGQGSQDAVEEDSETEDYEITVDSAGSPDIHLDCYGAHEVTVTFAEWSLASPCSGPGGTSTVFPDMEAGDVVTVSAWHDTTWRVALYVNVPQPGDTPAPVAQPAE